MTAPARPDRLVRIPLLAALLLVTPALGGCAALEDLWDQARRPDIPVSRTPLVEGGWNTETRFLVFVEQPGGAEVAIEATGADGDLLSAEGVATADDPVFIDLPDGTWTVSYSVSGFAWETFHDVRVDGTPPEPTGLERIGDAEGGAYTIGAGATVPADARVELRDPDGDLLATALPHTVTGLGSGLHAYTLTLSDAAGNTWSAVVQVRAGDAKVLEPGAYSFGIVARYTNEVRVWDLSDMDAYLSPAAARSAVDGAWMGSGFGIDPDDPAVQDVVASWLRPQDDTTVEIAYRLFEFMFDELEYDDERLVSNTLMLPHQVLLDQEDPDAEASPDQDEGDDGLADDGIGNGVKGGVCRDLAATYVSLLRAAGVPARLVSGYLAGNVDGFHAWVVVYAGDVAGNPGPWMPVDVAPLDGKWDDDLGGAPRGPSTAMQAFGIRLPEYLALRAVPEAGEVAGWSTALSSRYQYGVGADPPELSFEKVVEVQGAQDVGVLCFDLDTLERTVASNQNACSGQWIVPDFVRVTERIIDYGVHVSSAARGTSFTAEIAFPFEEYFTPDAVVFVPYTNPVEGKKFGFVWDQGAGKLVAEFTV